VVQIPDTVTVAIVRGVKREEYNVRRSSELERERTAKSR
jgi:hypothetical protein